ASLVYRPYAEQVIERADATLNALDVRHVVAGTPEIGLDGTLHAAAEGGTLNVQNRASGTLDNGRIPLAKLDANLVAVPGAWLLETLNIDLGNAGKLTGTGRATRDDVAVDVHGDKIDLRGLHGQLRRTQFNVQAKASGTLSAQRIELALKQPGYSYTLDGAASRDRLTVH